MRISLNWLRELVNFNLKAEELAKTLTIAGFEVEEIIDLGKNADGVVIGKVLTREQHPNADKLSVCTVDIGTETPSTIVCGAANVKADIFVAVATLGTYLPAVDLKIKPAKLRGVKSEGMICSLSEVGLEKDSEGIHIFSDPSLTPGQDVRPLLGLDDVILDLTATANRADALSMVGVAREVAALTGADLTLPPETEFAAPSEGEISLDIRDHNACPAYIATEITDLHTAPSPTWLKRRLQAAGIRPINNVVDITNLILLEWGQPLHAFDREKLNSLAGNESLKIGVRFAESGEEITTLDSNRRTLETANLLITANNKPIALAGVMGGEATEVDENTRNIVLEAALFDSVAIRRSSRAVGLRSEASTRYERGVNLAEFERATQRAIALFQELAGGKVSSQVRLDERPDTSSRVVSLRLDRLHAILGAVKSGQIDKNDVERILTDLGCKMSIVEGESTVWDVVVPPYRYRDLEREIDLIEEVARLYGYDNFCTTLPSNTQPGYLSFPEIVRRKIRSAFRGVGLTELVQYSLVKPQKDEITLANPLFAEYSALRRDLIPGLINAFEYNLSQGNGALNAFEIGRIFWQNDDKLAENDSIGGILGGDIFPQGQWTRGGKPQAMSFYEAKGILESVFSGLGLTVEYKAYSDDERLHPGRTASLWLNGAKLGIFGQLHPQLCQKRDLPDAIYVFTLDFDVLCNALNQDELITPRLQVYSTYPGAARDLAFFAPLNLTVADITKTMLKAGGNLLEKVELFDEYKGKNVPENQRSLAFSLVYRAGDRTLTDKEVEDKHQKVRDILEKEYQVTLRS
jgi:phenylalanyl-tRNA synthetase beta chain